MISNSRLNLTKFISGKTVALVGPANYLSQCDLGRYIDSHDVVVRVNRGAEIIDGNEVHIGSRTDVIYNCLIEHPDNGGRISVSEYRKHGIRFVATVPNSDEKGLVSGASLHPQVKFLTLLKLKLFFSFHKMDHKFYGWLNEQVKCRANTGFAAIFDIMNMKPSKLFVSGYSFYLDNFFDGYKAGCTRDEEEFAKQCFVSVRHNQNNQWKFLKSAAIGNEVLEFDPILSAILDMERLDRDLFRRVIAGAKGKYI